MNYPPYIQEKTEKTPLFSWSITNKPHQYGAGKVLRRTTEENHSSSQRAQRLEIRNGSEQHFGAKGTDSSKKELDVVLSLGRLSEGLQGMHGIVSTAHELCTKTLKPERRREHPFR